MEIIRAEKKNSDTMITRRRAGTADTIDTATSDINGTPVFSPKIIQGFSAELEVDGSKSYQAKKQVPWCFTWIRSVIRQVLPCNSHCIDTMNGSEFAEHANRMRLGLGKEYCGKSLYLSEIDKVAANTPMQMKQWTRTLQEVIGVVYEVDPEDAFTVRVDWDDRACVPVLHAILKCTDDLAYFSLLDSDPVTVYDVSPSPFYTARRRRLLHAALAWFVENKSDCFIQARLVNHVVQLIDACYNCVGRHKEVFEMILSEYCRFSNPPLLSICEIGNSLEESKCVVRYEFHRFVDQFKRDALKSAFITPLHYLYRDCPKVLENLGNHGYSFWATTVHACLGVQCPYEDIASIDAGWTWGARNIVKICNADHSRLAVVMELHRFENFGLDFRSILSKSDSIRNSIRSDKRPLRMSSHFLPFVGTGSPVHFVSLLDKIRSKRLNKKHASILANHMSYFAKYFTFDFILERCAIFFLTSDSEVARRPLLNLIEYIKQADVTNSDCCDSNGSFEELLSPSDALVDASDPYDIKYNTNLLQKILSLSGVSIHDQHELQQHHHNHGRTPKGNSM